MSLIMRYVAALPKRFVADCRGVTSTLMALSFMGMLGFAGLATEVGLWYVKKRSMQSAADSAAFSAAIALSTGLFQTEAQSVAGTYGFVDGSGGTTVTVNNPPTSGPNTSASAVEVTISQPQTFTIARLFLSNALTIQARAVAVGASGNGCVLALDTANVTDDSVSGNVTVNLNNCSLYINSNSTHALSMSGGAKINAMSAFITGNYSASGGAALNTTNGTFTGVTPLSDPYATVSIPSYSGCNQTKFNLSGSASQTLSVGSSGVYVFCNGLNLSGSASLTLNPGIYVINGGSFNLSGGTTFNATGGVTIVLTGSTAAGYATANISGGANVNITAPTSGPTAGLAFFQDRNAPSSGTDSFSGGSTQTITGAIYFPHQAVNYSGGASAGGSNCTQLIAYTMTFSGGYVQQHLCWCRHRRHRGRKFKGHRMRCEGSTERAQRRSGKDIIPTARATLIRLKTMFAATGGLAAVEFAIVIPILLAVIIPVCDLGKGLSQQLQVWEAAQAGVQYATANGFASTAIQNAVTAATSLSSISATPAPAQSCGCPTGSSVAAANPAVPPCTGLCSNGKQSGTYVTVNATAVYYPLIPYPMLGSSVTLTAQAFARIQ